MSKELVLDIGIGHGGKYLKEFTGQNEQRVAIDTGMEQFSWSAWSGQKRLPNRIHDPTKDYPQVLFAAADGSKIPFGDSIFSRIEMIFPDPLFCLPGLEVNHWNRILESQTYREHCDRGHTFSRHPNGYYPELQRVLKPGGEMVIFGDIYIDPAEVEKTSKGYFHLEQQRRLSYEEVARLGTNTALTVLFNNRDRSNVPGSDRKFEEFWVRLDLRSTKA